MKTTVLFAFSVLALAASGSEAGTNFGNFVDGAVNGVGNGARVTGGLLRYLQSGSVQRYAALLIVGVIILAIVFTR